VTSWWTRWLAINKRARLMGISRSLAWRKISQHKVAQVGRSHLSAPGLKHALVRHFQHRLSVRSRRTIPRSYAVRWSDGPTIEAVIGYASRLEGMEGLSLHPQRDLGEDKPPGDRVSQASASAPEPPPPPSKPLPNHPAVIDTNLDTTDSVG